MSGEVIYTYTVEQAIKDGELIDVSHWAKPPNSQDVTLFTERVVFTRPLCDTINSTPDRGIDEMGISAFSILWGASEAITDCSDQNQKRIDFTVSIFEKTYNLFIYMGVDDNDKPLVTIGFSDDY